MMAKEKQHCNPSYLFPCPADSADKKAIIAPDTSLSGFTLQAYNYTIEPKGLAAFGSIGILHKKRSGKPAFQSAFMCKVFPSTLCWKPFGTINYKMGKLKVTGKHETAN
ncbi:hypothetical protein V1226_20235 [Lachnospiraceae bacterium JLR.KK009]